MTHIAIDARELTTSTGTYISHLLKYLQQLDKTSRYSVLLKPGDMAGWTPTNPNFTAVACPHKEFTFDEQLGFLSQLNGLHADLIHFGMTHQPILYRGRSVTTVHDLTTLRFKNPDKNRTSFLVKQAVYAQVIKRVAAKSAAIITPSQYVKDDLAAFTGVDPDKITVTYESGDSYNSPATPLSDLQKKQFIMYVGRPTPHKNLERLIEAFQQLKAHHPALHLVLAGKKDANYQRIEAANQGVKNLVFTDYVTEGELRWLYEHCQAYVFPSLSEGFGLPGLEAMQHGAPVVSSNATCLPEIYGDAAHYFDPLDVTSMTDAINEILTDAALRTSLIERGHKQVKKYSWHRMAEQTLSVYDQALKK